MKAKQYLILDCETATLDFADAIAAGDPEIKKKIAIARPLIYDIGWCITNRKGEIQKKVQYLISEIFCVPAIFNTAYYADKRPIYIDMLNKGLTSIQPWNKIIAELVADMENVEAVGAYNSMFDFKKAIPFTELYINKVYSADFNSWYNTQRVLCEHIAKEPYSKDPDKEFDPLYFTFRSNKYNLFDLWGLSVTHLLDRQKYREKCIIHNNITASGIYFKTSAESSYQYLLNNYGFIESHTALDDAEIETYIFSKIATRHKVTMGIDFFPFRKLGYTDDYVLGKSKINPDHVRIVADAIRAYINTKDPDSDYVKKMVKRLGILEATLAAV